jgi:hypothetical protein
MIGTFYSPVRNKVHKLEMRRHCKDLTVIKKDGRSHERKTKEAICLMAVERICEREDMVTVMASYGRCRTTGNKWLAKVNGRGRWNRRLAARKGSGRKPKLTWA